MVNVSMVQENPKLSRPEVFKWLDEHPFASSKELKNHFNIKGRVLSDYYYQWKQSHQDDVIKKKLIFLYHLSTRKMIPDSSKPITMDEKEILFSIEGLVMQLEKELGYTKRGHKDVMELLVERGVLIPLPPEEKKGLKKLIF